MVYCDYTYYSDNYKGSTVSEGEFDSLSLKASRFIDLITFGRINEADNNIKNAVCSVCEEMKKCSLVEYTSSESNDGYSISYKKVDMKKRLYEAAKIFLPPELLYKGVEI